MDFGSLLHVAQKNGQQPKKEIKYYSTKFEPPKKEERSKQLSDNIKKFLARKEAEEKQKALEAKLKKEELLALRSQDRKATRRVAVMLKRTKSANKSVIEDAVDNDNTAVTLAGPSQPDEDDYGYVSQEASAFYNKMMAKYNNMPEEEKFTKSKKNVNTNLKEIKDRVSAAILREQEEALLPHKRKRKPKESQDDSAKDKDDDKQEIQEKPKPKPKTAAPPPLNFNELLKIAEKKQFEPIKIEPKVELKEDERPMTKKQKREYEKEKAWREKKEKGITNIPPKSEKMGPPPNRIPKLNPKLTDDKNPQKLIQKSNLQMIPKKSEDRFNISKKLDDRSSTIKKIEDRPGFSKKIDNGVQNSDRRPDPNRISKLRAELEKVRSNNKIPPKISIDGNSGANRSQLSKSTAVIDKNKPFARKELNSKDVKTKSLLQSKQFSTSEAKPKQFPPADLKPKQFPPADIRPKQFPPPDVRRKPKDDKRKPSIGHKRRILDDDSDHDSEMDDFIDDGPEGAEDYSKYISEIFGYDKSKYRQEDYDDANMESSFSQMMREEFLSSKIGLMEDLEDMKQEAEDKKRKAMMKKMRK